MPDDNQNLPPEHHPAEMSDSDRRSTKTWHVLKTAGKWLLGGAVVGGLLLAAAPVLLTASLGSAAIGAGGWWSAAAGAIGLAVPETAKHMGAKVLETVGAWALNWGATGALVGAAGAGAIGLFSGLSSMDAKVDDVNEEQMANYDRGLQRQRQIAAMKMQQRQLDVNMRKMEGEYGLAQTNLPNRNAGKGAEIS